MSGTPSRSARFSLVQLRARSADTKARRLDDALGVLERLESDLVLLPELWPTGYFAFEDYASQAEPLDGPTMTVLGEAARRSGTHLMAGSFVELDDQGRLYNTAVLFGPTGEMLLTYRKMHVFGYQSREAEILSPGEQADVVDTPLGRISMTTCYDLRFPELYRLLTDRGAEMILIPSAWPLARLDHWRLFTRVRAVENQVHLLACNMSGVDHGTELAGHSVAVGPWGEVLIEGDEGESVLEGVIDLDAVERVRNEFPVLADRVVNSS